MKIKFTNRKTKIKDGKTIAFATIELYIDGQDYPVRLSVTADNEAHTRSDRAKLNTELKRYGFKIGEVNENEEVPETSITLVH